MHGVVVLVLLEPQNVWVYVLRAIGSKLRVVVLHRIRLLDVVSVLLGGFDPSWDIVISKRLTRLRGQLHLIFKLALALAAIVVVLELGA